MADSGLPASGNLRVLWVSDVYFPRVNGVSTSIRTFRSDLGAQGIDTVLVAPRYGPDDSSEAGLLRVPAKPVPQDPEDRLMRWGALRATLAAQRFDLVHVQTPFLAHYAGVKAARRAGKPVIATYHTFFEDYLHHYLPVLPRLAGRALARSFTRSQCRDVDQLIAPTAPMQQMLQSYGVTVPIDVLPTGLPRECFQRGDGARFRRQHGVPPERPLLLYVGRVAFEKNIDFLLRMFAQLRTRRSDALLMIAGEGPALPSLQQQARDLGIAEHVRFVGYLARGTGGAEPGLLDCYAAADVFVFASRTETQGLVLLEAMAQGSLVVSTAELGTRSILTPESGAYVVPEDESAFAAAVVAALMPGEQADRRARLRAHAERWSSAVMARRLTDLYRHVLAERASVAPGLAANGQ